MNKYAGFGISMFTVIVLEWYWTRFRLRSNRMYVYLRRYINRQLYFAPLPMLTSTNTFLIQIKSYLMFFRPEVHEKKANKLSRWNWEHSRAIIFLNFELFRSGNKSNHSLKCHFTALCMLWDQSMCGESSIDYLYANGCLLLLLVKGKTHSIRAWMCASCKIRFLVFVLEWKDKRAEKKNVTMNWKTNYGQRARLNGKANKIHNLSCRFAFLFFY